MGQKKKSFFGRSRDKNKSNRSQSMSDSQSSASVYSQSNPSPLLAATASRAASTITNGDSSESSKTLFVPVPKSFNNSSVDSPPHERMKAILNLSNHSHNLSSLGEPALSSIEEKNHSNINEMHLYNKDDNKYHDEVGNPSSVLTSALAQYEAMLQASHRSFISSQEEDKANPLKLLSAEQSSQEGTDFKDGKAITNSLPFKTHSIIAEEMKPKAIDAIINEMNLIKFINSHHDFVKVRELLSVLLLVMEGGPNEESITSIDAIAVFFSVKRVAGICLMHWLQMEKNRNGQSDEDDDFNECIALIKVKFLEDEGKLEQLEESIDSHIGQNNLHSVDSSELEGQFKNINSMGSVSSKSHESKIDFLNLSEHEWDKLEEVWWDIAEKSIGVVEMVTVSYIGPMWQMQIKMRLGRILRSRQYGASVVKDRGVNHIPENVPLQILMFSSDFGNMIFPPIKHSLSRITLSCDVSRSYDGTTRNKCDSIDLGDFTKSRKKRIWEEQRWLIRRQRFSGYQRNLTTALCVESDEIKINYSESNGELSGASKLSSAASPKAITYSWSIPGAHFCVTSMINHWLQTALVGWPSDPIKDQKKTINQENYAFIDCNNISLNWSTVVQNGPIDWWFIFQVSKSISDLVKAGWRPPPSNIDDGECIFRLLEIATLGVIMDPEAMKFASSDSQDDAREERIVAASAAFDALEALQHLVRKGCLPEATVSCTTCTLCYLLIVLDPSKANSVDFDMFPIPSPQSSDQRYEFESEIETFIDQRDACVSEIAELLWSMVAMMSTMDLSVDAALSILRNLDLSVLKFGSDEKDCSDRIEILSACGAVRSLGASIWGNPPEIKGIDSLRSCWSIFLDILSDVASSGFHSTKTFRHYSSTLSNPTQAITSIQSRFSMKEASSGAALQSISRISDMDSFNTSSLALIYEIMIAVKRFVKGQILNGADNLTSTEWESFLSMMEFGLLPWLAFSNWNSDTNKNEDELVDRKMLLIDGILAEIDEMFRDMELFLTFSSEGLFIHHRISDEIIRRRFQLFYLQCVAPLLSTEDADSICLAIIDSWVCGGPNSYSSQEWQFKCSDLLSNIFAVYENRNHGYCGYVHSCVVRDAALRAFVNSDDDGINDDELGSLSSSFRKSSTIDRSVLSRFTKNIHGSVICKAMIPFLSEVILAEERFKGILLANPSTQPRNWTDDGKKTKLLLSAIRIVGDLLLSSHLELQDRHRLLDLLKNCALDKSLAHHLSASSSEGLLANALYLNDWGKWIAIKFGVIKQLSLYLRACLSHFPNLHSFVPEILSVLYETIRIFLNCDLVPGSIKASKLVSFAALCQLSCLQSDEDGHIFMMDESQLISIVPYHLALAMDKVRFIMDLISTKQVWDDALLLLDYKFNVIDTIRSDHQTSMVYFKRFKDAESTDLGGFTYQSHGVTHISLEEIVSLIVDIISAGEDSSTLASQDFHSINFVFSTQDDTGNRKLLSELSLEIIRLHILSGSIEDPVDCWMSLSASSIHLDNCLSRFRLLSIVAGFLATYKDINASSNVFKDILDGFHLGNIESLQVCCEGTLCALSAASCMTKKEIQTSSWHQDACAVILQQLRPIVDNVTGYSYEVHNSPIIMLLTTLYGALLLYSPQKDRFSGRMKGDIIIVCHDICVSMPNSTIEIQIYLLAILCASVAVASIDTKDLSNVIGLISKRRPSISYNENKNVRHTVEFADVLFDLLVQKCLYFASKPAEKNRNLRLSRLEIIAKDVEDIEAFKTNEADDKNVGVWLCNKMLIICRVGSGDSRYRGFVEITLRSPSTRVRRLVRLSDPMSLMNPDFPSNLWNSVLPILDGFDHQKITEGITVKSELEVYNAAKSTLQRCDRYKRHHLNNDFGVRRRGSEFGSSFSLQQYGHSSPEAQSQTQNRNAGSDFGSFLSVALNGNEADIYEVEEVFHELDGSTHLLDSVYGISDEPKQLKWGPKIRRAVNILDRTAFLQTHKIALLLDGPLTNATGGEYKEIQDDWILNVTSVTPLFSKFSSGLGSFISTSHLRIYSGGIDISTYRADGEFALIWLNGEQSGKCSPYLGETMVLFHSVPLMPPGVNNRKRHVGNDVVHIIFCENSKSDEYSRNNIISGEFCFITIFVTPICSNKSARVTLKVREDLPEDIKNRLGYLSSCVVMPFEASAPYTRELSVRADVACRSLIQDRLGLVSNWQERLQQINNLDRYAVAAT